MNQSTLPPAVLTGTHPGAAQQQPEDPRDWFRAGVTASLRSWSALRTAVESGWGGPESAVKAEGLRDAILGQLDFRAYPPKTLDLTDLEDHLAIYLEEEFSVVLEDASERQVAETVWHLYERCFHGDVALARQLVAQAEGALNVAATHPSQLQSSEHDDDDESDEEMMDADNEPDRSGLHESTTQPIPALSLPISPFVGALEYANQPLFGSSQRQVRPVSQEPMRQLGEAGPAAPARDVDDDGFATVSTKRKPARKPA